MNLGTSLYGDSESQNVAVVEYNRVLSVEGGVVMESAMQGAFVAEKDSLRVCQRFYRIMMARWRRLAYLGFVIKREQGVFARYDSRVEVGVVLGCLEVWVALARAADADCRVVLGEENVTVGEREVGWGGYSLQNEEGWHTKAVSDT